MGLTLQVSPNLSEDQPIMVVRIYEQPELHLARGGLAKAEMVRKMGRDGDEVLLHINPVEYEWLKEQWGPPKINPNTGLPEYGFFSKLFSKLKGAASADATPWKVKNLLHTQRDMLKNYGGYAAAVASLVFPALAPAVGAWLSAGAATGATAAALGGAAMGAATGAVSGGAKGALAGAITGGAAPLAGDIGHFVGAGAADAAGSKIIGNAIAGAAGAGVTGGDIAKGALTSGAIAAVSPVISNAIHGGDVSINGVSGGGDQNTMLPDSYTGIGSGHTLTPGTGIDSLGDTSLDSALSNPDANTMANSKLSDYGDLVGDSTSGANIKNVSLDDLGNGPSSEGNVSGGKSLFTDTAQQGALSQAAGDTPGAAKPAAQTGMMANIKKYAPLLLLAQAGGAGAKNASNNMPDMTTKLPQINFNRTPNQQGVDYYTYGSGPEHSFFNENQLPGVSDDPTKKAQGGLSSVMHPQMPTANAQNLVRGPGTGRSDDIPAKLSDGEYVMDAESVAMLGDGSTDEGARRLDQLRNNLRQHKGAALARGKFSPPAKAPEQYMAGKGKSKPKVKGKGKPTTFQEPVGSEDDGDLSEVA